MALGPVSKVKKGCCEGQTDDTRWRRLRPWSQIPDPIGRFQSKGPTDDPRFFRILRKIIMGLYYCKTGRPLPGDHGVHLAWENWYTRPVVEPLFPYMRPVADFGDDVFIYTWMRDWEDRSADFSKSV